jgi:alkylated DNA repair dioxygenase AlkB
MKSVPSLFPLDSRMNVLPQDGQVNYYGTIFDRQIADFYFDHLLSTIPWQHDEVIIFGKKIITARKVAWLADEGCSYTYSGTTKEITPWTQHLLEVKTAVEKYAQTQFNSCLLNLYHHGSEGMGWHSDDEASLGKNCTIASVSFGASRKFAFKHKSTKQTISLMLEHGSLLMMQGATQHFWKHALLKSTKIDQPRINLTFRNILH